MFRETGTKATWANPTVTPVAQRQNGGWYYNPATGSVDRWWNDTPTVSSTPTSTVSSGGSTPDFGVKNYQDTLSQLIASRKNEGEQAMKDYEAKRAQATQELGIPGLTSQLNTSREEVMKVKDLLSKLETDINARTSGQLLSENQRRRLLAAEETPLRTQLGSLISGQESSAGQLQVAYQEIDRRLAPLLAKISSNQVLSQDEWQLASNLAVAEQKNNAAIELEKLKAKTAGTGVSGGDYYGGGGSTMAGGTVASIPTETKPTWTYSAESRASQPNVTHYSPGAEWIWVPWINDWVPAGTTQIAS